MQSLAPMPWFDPVLTIISQNCEKIGEHYYKNINIIINLIEIAKEVDAHLPNKPGIMCKVM